MKKRRYEEWAGTGIPKCWKDLGFDDPSGVVWPIVDNETCGPIDGTPEQEQWFAVAFTPAAQAMICKLLNDDEEKKEYEEYLRKLSEKGQSARNKK